MITIALIGRTNVGKSTLFNRIIGRAKALTSELSHTTRDRNIGETTWRGETIRCIDTGGIEEIRNPKSSAKGGSASGGEIRNIEHAIQRHAIRATEDADIIIFVNDARDGVLPGDHTIARDLRRLKKPILVACNKAETKRLREGCLECNAFGFGNPIAVSAVTGMGVGDLLDEIVACSQKARKPESQKADADGLSSFQAIELSSSTIATRVAIVGEPNVGKSSLVNAILGREEVIVRPEPFTTRDIHDVDVDVSGECVTLLDTAGIRRLAVRAVKTSRTRLEAIERQAVKRGLAAIERSDVVVLVLDATRTASRHTKQLASMITEYGRACVIVVNKMDLIPEMTKSQIQVTNFVGHIHTLFSGLAWSPVIPTSATTPFGVPKILPTAIRAAAAWRRMLTADQLAAIHALVKRRIPTARTRIGKRRSNIVELSQTATTPPTFLLRTRQRVILPKAIPAIVERTIRESQDFEGSPIRIVVKSIKP